MRHALLTAAVAAAAGLMLAGCGSKSPAAPGAAPISDLEAAGLADRYLDEQNVDDRVVTSIEPHGYGYFVSYRTEFDEAGEPPAKWHVVDVRHDGNLRAVDLGDDDDDDDDKNDNDRR